MVRTHCLKPWSSTQKSITLSSGEAELVAAVKTCSELIGLAQLAHDWGIEMECHVYVDSAAAIGVVNRRGSGKLRHVRVGQLWVQEKVEEEELKVHKVHGQVNVADMMSKYLPIRKIMNSWSPSGRGLPKDVQKPAFNCSRQGHCSYPAQANV